MGALKLQADPCAGAVLSCARAERAVVTRMDVKRAGQHDDRACAGGDARPGDGAAEAERAAETRDDLAHVVRAHCKIENARAGFDKAVSGGVHSGDCRRRAEFKRLPGGARRQVVKRFAGSGVAVPFGGPVRDDAAAVKDDAGNVVVLIRIG